MNILVWLLLELSGSVLDCWHHTKAVVDVVLRVFFCDTVYLVLTELVVVLPRWLLPVNWWSTWHQ